MDKTGSGSIGLEAMLDLMKDTKKEYVSRVFAIFDEDYDSRINFREFFVGCWNYCTISAVALPIFCFDLYDHDCSGEVELKEILIMLSEIYGGLAPGAVGRAVYQAHSP